MIVMTGTLGMILMSKFKRNIYAKERYNLNESNVVLDNMWNLRAFTLNFTIQL